MDPSRPLARKERPVTKAFSSLGDTIGSGFKSFKRYIASQGQIPQSDVKKGILSAIRNNKLSNPNGARGHFFFWNDENNHVGSKRGRKPHKKIGKTGPTKGKARPRKRGRPARKAPSKTKCRKSKRKRGRSARASKQARLSVSDIMKYSGMKLKNGKRLIVFTTKDR